MPSATVLTIERHILEQQRDYPHATGAFTGLLYDIALAAKLIARETTRAGVSPQVLAQRTVQAIRDERFYVLAPDHWKDLCDQRLEDVRLGVTVQPMVARDAFRLLAEGGRMLCVTNHRGTDLSVFRQLIREAALSAGVTLRDLETLAPPPDCAPKYAPNCAPSAESSATKSLLASAAGTRA